jgi:hypothetical protein
MGSFFANSGLALLNISFVISRLWQIEKWVRLVIFVF